MKDLDVNIYIISSDTPEEQSQLYQALAEKYGESIPFISDSDLKLIDLFDMKNGDQAYRGYGMMDQEGNVVFHTANDLWGDQFEETVQEIKKEYKALKN